MGSSVERRSHKKHKYGKLENISKTLLYSLLGSKISRRSRKRSRSSSSSSTESRKTSRHNRKSRSRREKKKSKKHHYDIKQEKCGTSDEVAEIYTVTRDKSEIEVITIDEIFPEQSPNNIILKPKQEFSEQSENLPENIDKISNQNATHQINILPSSLETENTENSENTSVIINNNEDEESIATVCAKLVESWTNILHQGLSTEAYKELLKKYRLNDDSQVFVAPILNVAIKSFLTGTEIVRDDIQIDKQNQLGSLLVAIKKIIYLIANSEKKCSILAKILETMNDTASFIAQLHYSLSLERKILICENIGVIKMENSSRVSEFLFNEEEEKKMQNRISELIEFEIFDEKVKRRLDARKKAELEKAEEEAIKIAEDKAKKIAEDEAKKIAEQAKKIAEDEAKKIVQDAKKIAEEAIKIAEEKTKEFGEKLAKKIAEEEEANKMAEEEDEEELEETPCSQRFDTSRHSGRTLFKAKTENIKGVKSEGRVKAEKGTPQFVPNSDFPGIEKVVIMARQRQGFSKNAIPISLKSLAKSTFKLYEKHIQNWWDFSRRESCDTFDPKLSDVMEFFVECDNNGMNLNALKKARAGLSHLISSELGTNEYLSVLFKGFANKD